MYWPIGLPRIYAASSSKAEPGRILESEDDTESRETSEEGTLRVEDSSTTSESTQDSLLTPATPATPATPLTPYVRRVDDIISPTPHNGDENVFDRSFRQAGKEPILALKISRAGHIFATATATTLTVWQTKPTVVLAAVIRSDYSLEKYGTNTSLLVRPDAAIFVLQTSLGFLVTYSLAFNPDRLVYRPQFSNHSSTQARRNSNFGSNSGGGLSGPGESGGVLEASIRFRMVISLQAGIATALALEDEIIVATKKPPCLQCIRWTPDRDGNQTSTEVLRRMTWLPKKTSVEDMVHDRPMNLSTWITGDGRAYAVQRVSEQTEQERHKKLFRGYCFHAPKEKTDNAVRAAINARFSIIAIGCEDGSVNIYTARDYAGNIPLSHKHALPVSMSTSGRLTFLSYSPDGYCLFAGYEKGWATWSVFGKPGSTSFGADQHISKANGEEWLRGVKEGVWLGNGSEILLIGQDDDRLWVLEMARSAVTTCFASANIARTLLQTKSGIMVYRGYDLPDLTTISADSSLWHSAQIPANYLAEQWPMRCAVISPDGRYVAVAGRRGLAHYSVNSGRWKTFVNQSTENEFIVRGGMCWCKHILIAAVEADDSYEVRLYPREATLDNSSIVSIERLPAPVVLMALSGADSLLVYTHDNSLYHYIITGNEKGVRLAQMGQINFHGIIRSPARIRGLSWILPDDQLIDGDPFQDVSVASLILLIDGKLVLLQPSLNEEGKLKYDMRAIAQNIEYYALMRDQTQTSVAQVPQIQNSSPEEQPENMSHGLRDSLWTFDGSEMRVWPDLQDVLRSAPSELARELPPTVSIPVDFYPLSVLLNKGLLLGVEPELVQRRDINFAFFRFTIRTHLFIPPILRFHLSRYDSSAALHLAQRYQHLEYFSHALEILLHNVLDDEVDSEPTRENALLPGVLSFLSSFPEYLDIVVQCTRKTEVRSWRTLFKYLPPPQDLFEESLQRGALKTAGGYLLVLHTFEELSSSSEQLVRLLSRAKDEGDWELCKELARFLTALDESGATLREALERVDLMSPQEENGNGIGTSFMFKDSKLKIPQRTKGHGLGIGDGQGDGTSNGSQNSMATTPSPANVDGYAGGEEEYFPPTPPFPST